MLLDWEKGFGKVSHEGLHNAIERMNIDMTLQSHKANIQKEPNLK